MADFSFERKLNFARADVWPFSSIPKETALRCIP